jgi:predicted dehydrogenase
LFDSIDPSSKGRIEIEIPFNIPPDQKAKVTVFTQSGVEEIFLEAVDQYAIQADQFAQAIINDSPVPFGLEDAVNNMKVIEAVFESASKNSRIDMVSCPEPG